VDIIKKSSKKYLLSNTQFLSIAVIIVLLILAFYAKNSLQTISVKRSEIIIGTVINGNLEIVIEGYGVLKSAKQQLITALTRATVKEIILKPGAAVTTDSIIIKMENPELEQQVKNALQQLVQEKANLRQLKLNQKREALNENARIAEIIAQFESARLKRRAEGKLVDDGIIAKNTYEDSLLNEKQLEQRIEIFKQREMQLKEVHQEAINIQLEKIKQQQGKVEIVKQRASSLQVRAGLNGVLQRLSVELGQSVSAGQEIALIGSVKELIALIKVPQSQAQQLQIDQQAVIDTRRDKIAGTVVRIDPIVENNTVTVEIALVESLNSSQLPLSARPQSNVDAVIITDILQSVHYIERPANVRSNSEGQLYQLDDNFSSAKLRRIKFGRQAGRFIEIISGAQVGDQFILSDLGSLKKMTEELLVE